MLRESFRLALREIRRNALRSTLTILGVVIGVAAVITMVTFGSGATAKVTEEISRLGSNLLIIHPGQGFGGPGGARVAAKAFEMDDVEAIRRHVLGLSAAAPTASRPLQAIYASENWSTTVTGTDNAFFGVRNWSVDTGRVFSDGDLRAGKAVCILGATVRDKLFGGPNPVGAHIRLGKLSCEVIGTLPSKGQASFGNDQDDVVLIPIRTFQRRVAGNQEVTTIIASIGEGGSTQTIQAEIERLMRERRRIGAGEEDDFSVRSTEELASAMTSTTRVLTALLGAVAAVSLLVGGIGIMNIMLVSVTERTREIGIRLAIGALEGDVLRQFLVEAVVLSSFGGLLGIGLGLTGSFAASPLLGVPFVLEPEIVATAFGFSAGVGIAFGYFPARKAARLDPIEAVRYE